MKKSNLLENPKRVVVDTNVIISGILSPRGFPSKIINDWLHLKFIGLLSNPLILEITDVLSRPKIIKLAGVKSIHFNNIIKTLKEKSEIIIPNDTLEVCKDPKDNMLFELAEKGNADFIITGDKLVLEVEQYKKTKIVTPTWFAANILINL